VTAAMLKMLTLIGANINVGKSILGRKYTKYPMIHGLRVNFVSEQAYTLLIHGVVT
jgi:hypothetical protein